MKTIRLALLSFATVIGSLVASAQQAPAEAMISSVSGSASVTAPGSDKAVPAVAGQKLPEGAIITTAAGGSVLIQSHQGVETGIGANSTVAIGTHSVSADGVRTAVIDLKQGTTVSVLDPAKRAVNNYAVRTPKGVAAARGTTFTSTVKLSSGGVVTVTVNTLTGAVSFSIAGGATVNVAEGRSANDRSTASTSIADALKSASSDDQKDIAEALKITVTVVSVLAQVSNEAGAQKAQNTLNTVVENITEAANEVGGDVGTGIVASTVTAVATYAGKGSAAALATVNNTAEGANKTAATEAAATAPDPVVVTVVTTPGGDTAPIVVPPSTSTDPLPETPDITISISG